MFDSSLAQQYCASLRKKAFKIPVLPDPRTNILTARGGNLGNVFISYRRSDAEGWAGRLSDSLKAILGRIKIFRDIDDIPPGVEFDTYIIDSVSSCNALIVLIGPHWLAVTDKVGKRRLDDPTDFVRLEIATALKRDIRVIPLGEQRRQALLTCPKI